jgi:hypothetical protein
LASRSLSHLRGTRRTPVQGPSTTHGGISNPKLRPKADPEKTEKTMSTTEKQRVLRLIDDIVKTLTLQGTLDQCIGEFRGFAELDCLARERGVELYPLTRTGKCTTLVWCRYPWSAEFCNMPAIVNIAIPTYVGWLMNDVCPEHLKIALTRR